MMKVYLFFLIMEILLAAEATDAVSRNSERFEISPDHPMIIVAPQPGKSLSEMWSAMPDDLKPYLCVQIWPGGLSKAQKLGIPVVAHIRTWHTVPNRDEFKGIPSLEKVEAMFHDYPVLQAVIIAEMECGGFLAEEQDYAREIAKLAKKYNRYLIMDYGHDVYGVWGEMCMSKDWIDFWSSHSAHVIPMWEMNSAVLKYQNHSYHLGLYLSGLCDNWGINPQTWYWGEAGYAELGTDYGYMFRKFPGSKKEKEKKYGFAMSKCRAMFPFYGQFTLMGALTGATVYWYGGERTPHIWKEDGSFTPFWTETIYPLWKEIIKHKLIVPRKELLNRVKVALYNPDGYPCIWDNVEKHSGKRSLKIIGGGSLSKNMKWIYDRYVPIDADREYEFSCWIRSRNVDGSITALVGWHKGGSSTYDTDFTLLHTPKGDTDWREYRVRVTPKPSIRYATIRFDISSTKGAAWFDDVCLRPKGGVNLLKNPNFEEPRPTAPARPRYWLADFGTVLYDISKPRRGTALIWQTIYGMRHNVEFLPNNGNVPPLPTLPPAISPKVQNQFALLQPEQFKSDDDIRHFFARFERHSKTEGFVLQYPNLVWGANSYENIDKKETIHVETRDLRVTAQLDVHSYFALKDDRLLIVEGRKDRKTILRLMPRKARVLGVVGQSKAISAIWNAREKLLEIVVDHSKQKLVVVTIASDVRLGK